MFFPGSWSGPSSGNGLDCRPPLSNVPIKIRNVMSSQCLRRCAGLLPLVLLLATCVDGEPLSTEPPGLRIRLEATGLVGLDASREGSYRLWLVDGESRFYDAGGFAGGTTVDVELGAAVADGVEIAHAIVTVEPPADADPAPSAQKLLGGAIRSGRGTLSIDRYVTVGIPLEPSPGVHVLRTPSDDGRGGRANDDAGLWLYNAAGDSADGSLFVRLTPVTRGWIYEGWIVRDYGTAAAAWLSYGKFDPDARRHVSQRDDTGPGPYSGQPDWKRALPGRIFAPGDDWLTNGAGYPIAANMSFPLDLNGCLLPPTECQAAGQVSGPSRWTHVITIEPVTDEDEMPWLARPFPLLRPYRNPIGEAGAEVPRVIGFDPSGLPQAVVTLTGGGR